MGTWLKVYGLPWIARLLALYGGWKIFFYLDGRVSGSTQTLVASTFVVILCGFINWWSQAASNKAGDEFGH